MKALWLKDFYIVRKYLILLAIVTVLIFIVGSFLSIPALVGVMVGPYLIVFLMLTIYLMNLDINENFYVYGLSFPVTRKTMLLVKYGEFLLMHGLILVMGMGGLFIIKKIGSEPELGYIITAAISCLWSFYMLYFPVALKYNPKESTYPSLILIAPGLMTPLLNRLSHWGIFTKISWSTYQWQWFLIGGAVFFFLLSFIWSYQVMMKKEF